MSKSKRATTTITPVAQYRASLQREPKQTTLTQIHYQSDSDDDVFVSPKRSPPTIDLSQESITTVVATIIASPPKKKRKARTATKPKTPTSSIKSRQIDPKTPPIAPIRVRSIPIHPGDLVMSTAGRMQHPCFLSGILDDAYILFGVVRSYCFMNWGPVKKIQHWKKSAYSDERLNIEWMTFINGERRYIDAKNKCLLTEAPDDEETITDTTVQSPDVSRECVTLIARKGNSNLDHLNGFLASGARESVYFAKPEGWTCY